MPICPACGMHLSFGPVIAAPAEISNHAAKIRTKFAALQEMKPVRRGDYTVAAFAAAWHATIWLPFFPDLISELETRVNVGKLASGADLVSTTLRSVQLSVLAHAIGDIWPQFVERLWLSNQLPSGRRDAGGLVLRNLEELCRAVGGNSFVPSGMENQELLSFYAPGVGVAA